MCRLLVCERIPVDSLVELWLPMDLLAATTVVLEVLLLLLLPSPLWSPLLVVVACPAATVPAERGILGDFPMDT